MTTTKKRLNISLPNDIQKALERLAKRDSIPQATKALHLLERALEIEEDEIWDIVVQKRDTKGAQFITHKKVWA